MAPKRPLPVEELIDSLATLSSVLFNHLKTMECNQCEPCGEFFMSALRKLSEAGNSQIQLKGGGAAERE